MAIFQKQSNAMEYKKTDAPQPDVKDEEGKEEEKNKSDEEEEEEKLGERSLETCHKPWLTKQAIVDCS